MSYEIDDLPNLVHWKSVMEFTVEQAALLMAMIDPFDVESLDEVKRLRLPRWKEAHGHALGIISAIRQGLISPVACFNCIRNSDGFGNEWDELKPIKPFDRSEDINPKHTIITRASLLNWINSENVQIIRPKPTRVIQPQPAIIESSSSQTTSNPRIALPYHGHTSEGLEYVDDAITQFWATYDPKDQTTAPSKDEIIEYLTSRGAGKNMADAVNLVLRPFDTRKAHLKNRKVSTRESQ